MLCVNLKQERLIHAKIIARIMALDIDQRKIVRYVLYPNLSVARTKLPNTSQL